MNLTAEEEYHITGTLTSKRHIERLLDLDAKDTNAALVYINEASGSFPAEDYLEDILREFKAITKLSRGATQHRLQSAVTTLEEKITTLKQASEYGAAELRNAVAELTTY